MAGHARKLSWPMAKTASSVSGNSLVGASIAAATWAALAGAWRGVRS